MRTVVLGAALAMAVSTPAPAQSPGRAEAEAYLAVDDCAATQAGAADVFKAEGAQGAADRLEAAEQLCKTAAAKLRKASFEGLDSTLAADGLDQMAKGLGQIEEGLRRMETEPAAGKKATKLGYLTYRYGLEKLERAKR
ncbi:MAG TPA: hypothetical protein VF138_08890 [Caulobacteraceae bacterium]